MNDWQTALALLLVQIVLVETGKVFAVVLILIALEQTFQKWLYRPVFSRAKNDSKGMRNE